MADPTDKVSRGVKERDGERCVSCGTAWGLSFQHRRAVGMGGSKIRPTYADGLAACVPCNVAFEGELQSKALRLGWKVARWVADPSRVPYWDTTTGRWWRITADGPWRVEVSARDAVSMLLDVYGPQGPTGGGLNG